MVISEEGPSAMIISGDGPSTSHDPPIFVILGPIPESEPILPEPELTTTVDSPAVAPTTLSPPVDLTPILEDVRSDPGTASPTDPSVSESYWSLKDRLSAILDWPLDSITAKDFSSVGKILQELFFCSALGRFPATALDSTASKLSQLKAAHDVSRQEIVIARHHASAHKTVLTSYSGFKDQCLLLQQSYQSAIIAREAKIAQGAALKETIVDLEHQVATDIETIGDFKRQIGQAPERLRQLRNDIATHRDAASSVGDLTAFHEREMSRISREWSEWLEEFRELLRFI